MVRTPQSSAAIGSYCSAPALGYRLTENESPQGAGVYMISLRWM